MRLAIMVAHYTCWRSGGKVSFDIAGRSGIIPERS